MVLRTKRPDPGGHVQAQTRISNFMPQDGMKVIVRGRVAIYEPEENTQVILDYMEPWGWGLWLLPLSSLRKNWQPRDL